MGSGGAGDQCPSCTMVCPLGALVGRWFRQCFSVFHWCTNRVPNSTINTVGIWWLLFSLLIVKSVHLLLILTPLRQNDEIPDCCCPVHRTLAIALTIPLNIKAALLYLSNDPTTDHDGRFSHRNACWNCCYSLCAFSDLESYCKEIASRT